MRSTLLVLRLLRKEIPEIMGRRTTKCLKNCTSWQGIQSNYSKNLNNGCYGLSSMPTRTTSKCLMFGDLRMNNTRILVGFWADSRFGKNTSIIYGNVAVKQHHHLSWSQQLPAVQIGHWKQKTKHQSQTNGMNLRLILGYWGDFCFPVNIMLPWSDR